MAILTDVGSIIALLVVGFMIGYLAKDHIGKR